MLDEDQKDDFKNDNLVFTRSPSLPPSSGPCKCLPGKRENRENLLRERRRGGGDATDGDRGGVTAEREERRRNGQKQREMSWFLISVSAGVSPGFFTSSSVVQAKQLTHLQN